jgi:hypothetical protein
MAGAEIKTENGKDKRSFVSNVIYQNISFRISLNASGFPCLSITAAYTGDCHGYASKPSPKISNVSNETLTCEGAARRSRSSAARSSRAKGSVWRV